MHGPINIRVIKLFEPTYYVEVLGISFGLGVP